VTGIYNGDRLGSLWVMGRGRRSSCPPTNTDRGELCSHRSASYGQRDRWCSGRNNRAQSTVNLFL